MEKKPLSCPCCSGKEYNFCCKPYHEGKVAEHAEELMRSRYSAYALNIPDYIIQTTHPASSQYQDDLKAMRRSISTFSSKHQFVSLKVLDAREKNDQATVTFTASLMKKKEDASFTEKSLFLKQGGKWLYKGGILQEGHAPNLVTNEELQVLPLAYYGEAVLRKVAAPIGEIGEELKKLIERMIQTMDLVDGVGLAAPQIHHAIRLFIMRNPTEGPDFNKVEVFINPKITFKGAKKWCAQEGCLSIPGIYADVDRSEIIEITYTNLDGVEIKKKASGWEAKIIQHEYDHIEGILFIDHLPPSTFQKILPSLKNLEERLKRHNIL